MKTASEGQALPSQRLLTHGHSQGISFSLQTAPQSSPELLGKDTEGTVRGANEIMEQKGWCRLFLSVIVK